MSKILALVGSIFSRQNRRNIDEHLSKLRQAGASEKVLDGFRRALRKIPQSERASMVDDVIKVLSVKPTDEQLLEYLHACAAFGSYFNWQEELKELPEAFCTLIQTGKATPEILGAFAQAVIFVKLENSTYKDDEGAFTLADARASNKMRIIDEIASPRIDLMKAARNLADSLRKS